MAHTCPDCGLACHCGGDIDDMDFGEDCPAADRCVHCADTEEDDVYYDPYDDDPLDDSF